jgi:hypothetical protein
MRSTKLIMEACFFLLVVFIRRRKSLQLTQIPTKCCLPLQDSVLLIILILISGIYSPLLFSYIFWTGQALHKFSWCNSSQFYSYLSLTETGVWLLIRDLSLTGVCPMIEISSFYWTQLKRFYFATSIWGRSQSQSPKRRVLYKKRTMDIIHKQVSLVHKCKSYAQIVLIRKLDGENEWRWFRYSWDNNIKVNLKRCVRMCTLLIWHTIHKIDWEI